MKRIDMFDILKWCFEVLVLFSIFDVCGLFIAYMHLVLELTKILKQYITKVVKDNQKEIKDSIAKILKFAGFKLIDLSSKI